MKRNVEYHECSILPYVCVILNRYDASGTDLIATGSSDSTVKVWDSSNASLKATLRGGTNNAILACDISNGIAVGGGTDKTCRVWDVNTERMVSSRSTCMRH